MRFQNKVCIVTGGNSGIGKATSLQTAKEGCKVVIVARSKESIAVEQEIIENGGEAFFKPTKI